MPLLSKITKAHPGLFSRSSPSLDAIAHPSANTDSQGHHHNHHHYQNTDSKQPYSLAINIESPPIVLYGPSNDSTGYLLSGLLILNIPHRHHHNHSGTHSGTHSGHHTPAHLSLSPGIADHHTSASNNNHSTANVKRPQAQRNPSSNSLLRNLVPSAISPSITPVVSSSSSLTSAASLSLTASPSYNGATAPTTTGPPLPESKSILLHSVTLSLNQIVTYGKPFVPPVQTIANCHDCRTKITTLARWDVLSTSTTFTSGSQAFPFSHMLPGALPHTAVLGSHGACSIRYELVASSSATYESSKSKKLKQAEVNVKMPLRVSRSVIKGIDKNSLRIFPPSNVTVSAVLPNVVYPKADFIVELKFDGLNEDKKRWRMRRLNWRIEETVQVKANSCNLPYHETKLKVLESHIRLNDEHKAPNSGYVLGRNVRRQAAAAAAVASVPITENSATNISSGPVHEPEEGQEIPPPDSVRNPLLHPHDHERENHANANANAPRNNNSSTETNSDSSNNNNNNNEENHELFLQEVRILEKGTVREGWKSDYSNSGTIELPVEISGRKLSTGLVNHISRVDSRIGPSGHIDKALDIGNDANCSCDISDPELGIFVTHNLILEANLAEELVQPIQTSGAATFREGRSLAKNKKQPNSTTATTAATNSSDSPAAATASGSITSPSTTTNSTNSNHSSTNTSATPKSTPVTPSSSASTSATGKSPSVPSGYTTVPTGITRLFRMRFKLVVTERSGFGISWDEEVPPQYSQVSTFSPPSYGEALLFSEENEFAELKI